MSVTDFLVIAILAGVLIYGLLDYCQSRNLAKILAAMQAEIEELQANREGK